MKIAIFGDIHLRKTEKLGKQNILLDDKLYSIEYFVSKVIEFKIPVVVFTGDIFDRVNPPQWLRDKFFQLIEPLIENNIFIYFILGNHDTNWESTNFLKEVQLFGKKYNMEYIDKVKKIDNIVMAPYGAKKEDLIKGDVLITHNGIEGGLVGFYDLPLDSFEYDASSMSKYKFVFAGHYHKPHNFDIGSTKVYYIGSSSMIDFSEREEQKRFIIFDSITMSIESVNLPEYRNFIQFNFQDDEDPIEFNFAKYKDELNRGIAKLKFVGSELWFNSINHLQLHRVLYDDYHINDLKIETDLVSSDSHISVQTLGKTDVEILDEFCANQQLDEDLSIVGRKILEEVINKDGDINN